MTERENRMREMERKRERARERKNNGERRE